MTASSPAPARVLPPIDGVPRALVLPPIGDEVWALAGRARRGERLSLAENLQIATSLSFPGNPNLLHTVAEILAAAEAEHVLVGGLAVGALSGVPRATVDVDLAIWERSVPAVLAGLEARFGKLTVEHYRGLVRVAQPAMDLILADGNVVQRQAMDAKNTIRVNVGEATLRLPCVESAMVLKIAAALSVSRSVEDSRQDITDLGRLLVSTPTPDLERTVALARVLRTRSPKEIARILETLKAGGGIVVTRGGSMNRVTCVMPEGA